MTPLCLWLWSTLAHAAPWSIDAAGRLTAVGWTPSANGGGVDLGAVAEVAGGERVRFALGPRFTIDQTAMLGTPVGWLASAEVLGRPSRGFWIDGRLVAGVETTWLPAGWLVEAGEAVAVPARAADPAARIALSLGLGPSFPVDRAKLRPYVRYEQAVILGFAPEAGVPLMVRASVAIGLALDLPTRSQP
jgi:hypothetical protein